MYLRLRARSRSASRNRFTALLEAVVEFDKNAFRPKPTPQLLASNEFSGMLQETDEHV